MRFHNSYKKFVALATMAFALSLVGATTASAGWTGPTQLFEGQTELGFPTVTSGSGNGDRLVVRTGSAGLFGQKLFGRWISASGTLGTEFSVSAPTGMNQQVNSLTASGNANGDVCVVWAEGQQAGASILRARVYRGDHTPGLTVNLSGPLPAGFDGWPQAGVDADGRCVIVWSQSNFAQDGYNLKRRTITWTGGGSTHTFATGMADGTGLPSPGRLAVAPNGKATLSLAYWQSDSSTSPTSYAAGLRLYRFNVTTNAGRMVEITPVTANDGIGPSMPEVSQTQDGRSIVAWAESTTFHFNWEWVMRVATVSASDQVAQQPDIENRLGTNPNVRLATNADGEGTLAWDGNGPGEPGGAFPLDWSTTQIRGQRVDATGVVGSPFFIEGPTPNYALSGSFNIAADASGDVYALGDTGHPGENMFRPAMALSRIGFDSGVVDERALLELPRDGAVNSQSLAVNSCGKAVATVSIIGPPPSDPFGNPDLASGYAARSTQNVQC